MRFLTGLAALLPLLASGVSFGQESATTLGATAGFTVFNLPGIETGVYSTGAGTFDNTNEGLGVGATVGASGGFMLGKSGDLDIALGISGFVSVGRSTSSAVDSFSGPGVVVIPGYTTPGTSSIALGTASGGGTAGGSSSINHTNPQGGGVGQNVNIAAGAGTINAAAAAPSDNGDSFVLGGVVSDGATNSAAAYGAIGATDGGIFIGAGDLTGLTVTTNVTRDFLHTGADLSLAVSGVGDGGMALQGYMGPSYRFLGQRATSNVSVDIPEIQPSSVVFPTYSMDREEDLSSHYIGGVAGLSATNPLGDNLTLTLGGEGGLYYTIDRLTGTESYSIAGGANTVSAYSPQTVVNANAASDSANGVAWAARGHGVLTMALAPNRQLHFGGSLEYLSRVATVDRSNNAALAADTYLPGSDDGSLTYSAASSNLPLLSFGDAWSFTGTVSFTGQF